MAEWVAIFVLLPALIQIFPKLKVWTTRGKHPPLSRIKILGFKTPPRWFATASLLFFAVAFYGSGRLKIDDTPHDLFPKDHPVHEAVNYLRESRGWEASVDVLISEPEKEAFLIESLKHHPLVVQIEAADLYRKHFTQDVPANFQALVQEEITMSPAYSRYVSADGTVRLILYLNKTDLSAVNSLRSYVSSLCPQNECQLGGSLVSYAEFGDRVPQVLMESLLSSMFWVIVTMILLTLARRENEFFPIVASSLWGPAFLIAMLYLLQVKIYFVTCIFASILVGFAGDNAVHYLFSSKSSLKDGIHNRALPSMYLGICMIGIPLVFLLSDFNPMRSLGLLFVAGAAAGTFGDLWILKGLLRRNQ
jgi:predicted RND superfamily exporter protein